MADFCAAVQPGIAGCSHRFLITQRRGIRATLHSKITHWGVDMAAANRFKFSRPALRGIGVAAFTVPVLLAGTMSATAAVNDAAAAPTVRGDVTACYVAPPPGSTRIANVTPAAPGMKKRSYKNKGLSTAAGVAYFLSAARSAGYKVSNWGAGGSTKGTGFYLEAHSKKCGYLKVDGGRNYPAQMKFRICTGATSVVFSKCVK